MQDTISHGNNSVKSFSCCIACAITISDGSSRSLWPQHVKMCFRTLKFVQPSISHRPYFGLPLCSFVCTCTWACCVDLVLACLAVLRRCQALIALISCFGSRRAFLDRSVARFTGGTCAMGCRISSKRLLLQPRCCCIQGPPRGCHRLQLRTAVELLNMQ